MSDVSVAFDAVLGNLTGLKADMSTLVVGAIGLAAIILGLDLLKHFMRINSDDKIIMNASKQDLDWMEKKHERKRLSDAWDRRYGKD